MLIYQCKCGNIITNPDEECLCNKYVIGCDPYEIAESRAYMQLYSSPYQKFSTKIRIIYEQ